MSYADRYQQQERRVRRMAGRNGADLDLALMCNAVTPGEVQTAVHLCAGCLHPDDCERRIRDDVEGVPDYCRNAAMIGEVRSLLGE